MRSGETMEGQSKSGHGGASRIRTWGIVLLVALALVTGAGFERLVGGGSASGTQNHEELEDLEEFDILAQTYDYIRDLYVRSDDISDEELIWGAAAGMMDALGDTGHSRFLNPEEADDLRELQTGSFVGIGVRIDYEVVPPVVIFPYEGSPAEEAGILPLDEILAVDGEPYSDYADNEEFLDLIGGPEDTDVELELRHYGEVQSYTVTITRGSVAIETVSWSMLPDNVMWVRLSRFEEGTSLDFQRALRRGKRMGAEALILDMRGNPGGLVSEQMSIIGQFVEPGTLIVTEEDAEGNINERVTEEEDGEWRDLPVVVLIDETSVSAAEVTAAALAQNDRAITIGQTTYGTGTTIIQENLDDGSMVSIGILTWLTPDGSEIWHVGLDPMIEVANEPGVAPALPYLLGTELTMEELLATNDDQLLTGFDEVLNQVAP